VAAAKSMRSVPHRLDPRHRLVVASLSREPPVRRELRLHESGVCVIVSNVVPGLETLMQSPKVSRRTRAIRGQFGDAHEICTAAIDEVTV
jgi:hypothetical protein